MRYDCHWCSPEGRKDGTGGGQKGGAGCKGEWKGVGKGAIFQEPHKQFVYSLFVPSAEKESERRGSEVERRCRPPPHQGSPEGAGEEHRQVPPGTPLGLKVSLRFPSVPQPPVWVEGSGQHCGLPTPVPWGGRVGACV